MKLTPAQFDREAGYRFSLAVMGALQEKGLITQEEYRRIEPILAQKFSPVWAGYPDVIRINAPEITCYSVLSEVICHTDKGIDTITLGKDG